MKGWGKARVEFSLNNTIVVERCRCRGSSDELQLPCSGPAPFVEGRHDATILSLNAVCPWPAQSFVSSTILNCTHCPCCCAILLTSETATQLYPTVDCYCLHPHRSDLFCRLESVSLFSSNSNNKFKCSMISFNGCCTKYMRDSFPIS